MSRAQSNAARGVGAPLAAIPEAKVINADAQDWEAKYRRLDARTCLVAEGNDHLLALISSCERVAEKQEALAESHSRKIGLEESAYWDMTLKFKSGKAAFVRDGESYAFERICREAERFGTSGADVEIRAVQKKVASANRPGENCWREDVSHFQIFDLQEDVRNRKSELGGLQRALEVEQDAAAKLRAEDAEASAIPADLVREMRDYRADILTLAEECQEARDEMKNFKREAISIASRERTLEAQISVLGTHSRSGHDEVRLLQERERILDSELKQARKIHVKQQGELTTLRSQLVRAGFAVATADDDRNEQTGRYPEQLSVTSENSQYNGIYKLVVGLLPNGCPLWKRPGAEYWIYGTTGGKWALGDEDESMQDFKCDTGSVRSVRKHEGILPSEILGGWVAFDGHAWVSAPDFRVF